MISAFLAEDNPLVQAALGELLRRDREVSVVGTVGNGEDAVAAILELDPDVVLMDVSMPRVDGVEATRRLVNAGYAGRIVMLAARSERDRLVGALDAGAVGYLLKDESPEMFRRALSVALHSALSVDRNEGQAGIDPPGA